MVLAKTGATMAGNEWTFGELKALWDLIDRVRRWFVRKEPMDGVSESNQDSDRRDVLILGPGGVGKTTFARLISLDYDFRFENPGDYQESIGIEVYTIAPDERVGLVVPPGQKHRRAFSWTELLEQITEGRFTGIMLFSADGHHSLGEISFKSLELYEQCGRKKPEFFKAFLESNRRDEMDVLRQLQPYLETSSKPIWLLSVVAKQDLWWNKRKEVEGRFREGEYGKTIEDIVNKRCPGTFRHEFAFVSLVIQNLTSGENEVLKKNTAGYGQADQIASLKTLIERLDSLLQWENQQ